MILKSRYVVPVDTPPIENGGVRIHGGRIGAIGFAHELSDPEIVDYGDALICPGFVNAHTHLELSGLSECVKPTADFVDWLYRLVAQLQSQPATKERVQGAVQSGVDQSIQSGVTMIGDITTHLQWSREILTRSPLRGVSFGEVIAIGTKRHRLHQRLDHAASMTFSTENIRAGVSPHATYTVEPDALRACVDRAQSIGAPLCIHLAETTDEDAFTRNGEGPFVDYLKSLQIWDDKIPINRCSPIELAQRTGTLTPGTIVAHANYVSDEEMPLLVNNGCHVAYCPRTHHAFDHPPHRFREMLSAGINVCIGTDSLASNPSLSVLEELRFLQQTYPDFSSRKLLAMGTIRGAQALGFSEIAGSLTVGKAADLVVIPIHPTNGSRGWETLFETSSSPIAVYIHGKLVCPINND